MIRMQELTPEVYYNNSRDFQLLCHLFDLVLNSTKTEADILFNLPLSTNSPDQLLNLMSTTFGLRLDMTKYTAAQLRAICSVAPRLMKYKGSLQAVHYLVAALMRVEGAAEEYLIEQDMNDPYHITISLPTQAKHKAILDEILPYITPAGVTYSIKQAYFVITASSTSYNLSQKVRVSKDIPEYAPAKGMFIREEDLAKVDQTFMVRTEDAVNALPGFWPVAGLYPDKNLSTLGQPYPYEEPSASATSESETNEVQ